MHHSQLNNTEELALAQRSRQAKACPKAKEPIQPQDVTSIPHICQSTVTQQSLTYLPKYPGSYWSRTNNNSSLTRWTGLHTCTYVLQ